MKTVIVLAGLIALALSELTTPKHFKTLKVDAEFVVKQTKVLGLLENVQQVNPEADYYKVGVDYDVVADIANYNNPETVNKDNSLWKNGMLEKNKVFSIFYEHSREATIALFKAFFYAKDFETFYKIASCARVYVNPGQFLYAFYIAILQRPDTQNIVLPAPYEIYPQMFLNMDIVNKLNFVKDQEGIEFASPDLAKDMGLVKEDGKFVVYANYSSTYVFNNDEQRLTYFTEDIGMNSYYYWFHSQLPFWWNGEKFGAFMERRGEIYYFFYKQLLNRYYFERLTNGLGPISEFSWFSPIPNGYYPLMATTNYPFVQRPDFFNAHTEENYEQTRFLDIFEKSFVQFLENGRFKAFEQEVDFHDPKTLNFVGNYWQYNADLFNETEIKTYQRSYEATARHLLSAAPRPVNRDTYLPSALDFYQTSLRDPAFYQLYNRIISYIIQFKEHLEPHKPESLGFTGVKIEDVKVDKLVTYFDFFEFNATNAVYFSQEALNVYPYSFVVRQPRLNHKHFNINVEIKSKVETKAVFRVFMAPKYDSNGYPISIEDNWNQFLLLDTFTHELVAGKNEIKRNSEDFFFYREDSVSTDVLVKMLKEGKVPKDMFKNFDGMPCRMMLPRGTKDGFLFQFFVMAYPYETITKDFGKFKDGVFDTKPFSYPFDRPVYSQAYFKQPNMFFKDVEIFHEGEIFPYKMNIPSYIENHLTNEVPK